jgi:ubiquinone/menaquinone biosynthesis C-methylase UbiE
MKENVTYWKKIKFIDNFLLKILRYNREKIHKIFLDNTSYNNHLSLLDVGTSSTLDENHNLILEKTKENKNISCFSNQDLSLVKNKFYHIKNIYRGDGRNINLEDNSFDIVYSSATIEHVGSFEEQLNFIKECYRIAKKSVFITTPNRFYTIDFHTKIPFLHWLPKKIHRKILKFIKLEFYSLEKNMNLMSKKDIINIMNILDNNNFKILKHKYLFFTSNLILVIKKLN